MKEANLTSKQPGKHRYKPATKPSDIADNHLNRQFATDIDPIRFGAVM